MMSNNMLFSWLVMALLSLACSKDDGAAAQNENLPRLSLTVVADLPAILNETSGLAWDGQQLISHNDRGNTNQLFFFDTTGANHTQASLSGGTNQDWEDLAMDEQYLYIHDGGNNNGNRRDLRIWRVSRSTLQNTGSFPAAGAIAYHFPSQTVFENNKDHNYDSEALFAWGDSLYFFTKNRQNQRSDLYALPKTPGNYPAHHKGNFNARALITGGTISPDGQVVVLTGIQDKETCILYVITNFSGTNFHKGTITRYSLGAFSEVGQIEAVTLAGNDLYLTSERVSKWHLPARLYSIPDFKSLYVN
jgi:hypothetical protein